MNVRELVRDLMLRDMDEEVYIGFYSERIQRQKGIAVSGVDEGGCNHLRHAIIIIPAEDLTLET
jgi:hypothetical protein